MLNEKFTKPFNILQHFKCSGAYYVKTKHHFKVVMCEHFEVSALIWKEIGDCDSPIKDHLFCNHLVLTIFVY